MLTKPQVVFALFPGLAVNQTLFPHISLCLTRKTYCFTERWRVCDHLALIIQVFPTEIHLLL